MADGQQADTSVTDRVKQPVVANTVSIQIGIQMLQAACAVASAAERIHCDTPNVAGNAPLHVPRNREEVVVERRFLDNIVRHGLPLPRLQPSPSLFLSC